MGKNEIIEKGGGRQKLGFRGRTKILSAEELSEHRRQDSRQRLVSALMGRHTPRKKEVIASSSGYLA